MCHACDCCPSCVRLQLPHLDAQQRSCSACLARRCDVCELTHHLHRFYEREASQKPSEFYSLGTFTAEVVMTESSSGLGSGARLRAAEDRELRADASCVRMRAACECEPRAIASRQGAWRSLSLTRMLGRRHALAHTRPAQSLSLTEPYIQNARTF